MEIDDNEDFVGKINEMWESIENREELVALLDAMAQGIWDGKLESVHLASYLRGLAISLGELDKTLARANIAIEGEPEWRLMGFALVDAYTYA